MRPVAQGGVAEALMALLTERTKVPHARLTAEDSFIATRPRLWRDDAIGQQHRRYSTALVSRRRMRKAVVVCPGRGTYNKSELGYLREHFPDAALLARFDEQRRAAGQPTVSELDSAEHFSVASHTRGDKRFGR